MAASNNSNSTCPACAASSFDAASGTCSRCGYASGELNRCPHCNAIARIEGVGQAAVCGVCGGPRILGNHGGDAARIALVEQKKFRGRARNASIATVAQAMLAAIATLIGLAILPSSILGKVIVVALAAAPMLLALRSRSRGAKARAEGKEASDRAWQAAAEDVASHAKKGITAPALAKTLGIEPAYAEKLLTTLAVHDRTRIDVGEGDDVVYSVAPADPTMTRIDDPLLDERTFEDEQLPAAQEQTAQQKASSLK